MVGVITEKPNISYFRGSSRVTAVLRDGASALSLCWFNEPWMKQQLPVGKEIRLYGHIRQKNGRMSMYNPKLITEEEWAPVYRKIPGLPGKTLRQFVREALSFAEEICPETLPSGLRKRYGLMPLAEALRTVHAPEDPDLLNAAERRFGFENMLLYMTGVAIFQQRNEPGIQMRIPCSESDSFWRSLPYEPTSAQRRVLEEIARDLRKETAMSRLIQGDVGCGKTAIAFGAAFLVCRNGYQTAMMAPTEILARQHYESARSILEPLGIRCHLLTGSTRAAERKTVLNALKDGSCAMVFGTHALISENVKYLRLGLVITDEQHRFGVRQRTALREKGGSGDGKMPHVLVMSATPIPRTLALILYGDLELSIVDEMPPGRKAVRTRIVPQEKREAMYRFLQTTVEKGQQAYVVCPLVEDSEELQGVISADSLFKELTGRILPGLRIGLTWGTQKAEQKEETLRAFADGKLDILVATTVIEVGVNVPNATVMVIENAERYGLSQLHQLRGRVGRGTAESWCFLRSDAGEKLRILCETNDGFEIARKDLDIRGPGDLVGTRQSGEAIQQLAGENSLGLLDEVQHCIQELQSSPSLEKEWTSLCEYTRRVFSGDDFRIARS